MSSQTEIPRYRSRVIVIRKWHVAVLSCLIIGGIAYLLSRDRQRIEVQVASPAYQDIKETIATSGTIVPANDFPARANFAGMVEKIFVHLGQKVHAGQMLIQMKDQYAESRVKAARAALDAAEVNAANVRMNGSQEDRIGFEADMVRTRNERASAASALASLKELEKKGSVSEAEVAAGQQRLDAANAALQSLEQRTTHRYSPQDVAGWNDKLAADKENLAAEKVSYANAHIASPIAGTVYTLPVQKYDFVGAGADLMHVGDLSKMKIQAEFDQPDINKLHTGEEVAVTWDGMPGRSWPGKITATPLAVTRVGPRSVGICTIELDNAKGDLPADTVVSIVVTVNSHAHVLTIPHGALYTDGPNHWVYRVKDGVLKKTSVEVGIVNVDRIEITKGLSVSDTIVLHAIDEHSLTDNLRVSVVR